MADSSSGNRWLVPAFAVVGIAIGAWLVLYGGSEPPDLATSDPAAVVPPAAGAPAVPAPTSSGPPAPANRIDESGRLAIEAAALRDGDVMAVGLALTDEARGSEPRVVFLASMDGRRLETTAVPAAGSGSGLRLEVDPEFLLPGRYLIHVKTAEKVHIPARRYVLEVQ